MSLNVFENNCQRYYQASDKKIKTYIGRNLKTKSYLFLDFPWWNDNEMHNWLLQAKDLPPLVLSPSMYFNYTQPEGQYVPYLDKGEYDDSKTGDAKPSDLINTFHMASGK